MAGRIAAVIPRFFAHKNQPNMPLKGRSDHPFSLQPNLLGTLALKRPQVNHRSRAHDRVRVRGQCRVYEARISIHAHASVGPHSQTCLSTRRNDYVHGSRVDGHHDSDDEQYGAVGYERVQVGFCSESSGHGQTESRKRAAAH
jgi:hypothetical protein